MLLGLVQAQGPSWPLLICAATPARHVHVTAYRTGRSPPLSPMSWRRGSDRKRLLNHFCLPFCGGARSLAQPGLGDGGKGPQGEGRQPEGNQALDNGTGTQPLFLMGQPRRKVKGGAHSGPAAAPTGPGKGVCPCAWYSRAWHRSWPRLWARIGVMF